MKKNMLKVLCAFAVAFVLALVVSGCGGTEQEPADAGQGSGMEELAAASGFCVTLDAESEDTFEGTVTLAEGESLVIASQLDSGEVELEVASGGEVLGSDFEYEGTGISETGYDPGDYTVTLKPTEAAGTIYVLAYPSDQLDFMNTDSDELFAQVEEFVRAAA